jgi:hypothetical protein
MVGLAENDDVRDLLRVLVPLDDISWGSKVSVPGFPPLDRAISNFSTTSNLTVGSDFTWDSSKMTVPAPPPPPPLDRASSNFSNFSTTSSNLTYSVLDLLD